VATHFHRLKVREIRKETPECISIAFEIPDSLKEEFAFRQGQNVTLRTTIDGEEVRRSYSICTSPLDNELRVAVKQAPFGRFSTWANEHLKPGDVLDVMVPTGKFYTELNPAHKKHYLAFAAGSGITPIISIIKTTLATEPGSTFTLVYGNRNRNSIIFKEELEALKNRYIDRFAVHYILSREKTDAPVNYGRINADKLNQLGEKLINFHTADEVFICGPEEMIFSVKKYLEEKGINSRNIHFELFTTPGQSSAMRHTQLSTATTVEEKTSKVTIKLDGVTFGFDLPFNGDTILEAALKQGADLPYSCKGGVCSTCKARLVEGAVDMEVHYALEQEEIDEGYILTCQSHPRTEKVVVDFDVR
jgi:phenylacetate-CoA oxygenase/reductase, PaaK subunit